MELKINGQIVKSPSGYDIGRFTLSKAERNAAGLMNADIVAKKVKLFLTYKHLSSAEYDLIDSLINGDDFFFDVTYLDAVGREQTKKMYVGEIRTPLARQDPIGGWYWKDVTFNFIER